MKKETVYFADGPIIPARDVAMGEAILAPGEETDVQLFDSHPTSNLVSISLSFL